MTRRNLILFTSFALAALSLSACAAMPDTYPVERSAALGNQQVRCTDYADQTFYICQPSSKRTPVMRPLPSHIGRRY